MMLFLSSNRTINNFLFCNKRPIFVVTSAYKMNGVRKPLFVVEKSNPVSAEQENQIAQDLAESTVFSFAGSQKAYSLDDEDSQQTAHLGG